MSSQPLVNNFEVPTCQLKCRPTQLDKKVHFFCENLNLLEKRQAGKPPPGLHLDVLKDGKMVQKLMIDEKKCYFFGRNKELCDFRIDHASCSRVHTALVWHKHLSRPFLIDLGSTHGTYIGHIRLESKKPQHVPIDSEIHFGASSRIYVIRERPQPLGPSADEKEKREDLDGSLLGLPETETELDNLTEFNTAHNRRIAAVSDESGNPLKRKHKTVRVTFGEDEEVINPEDIDPSIGRFRNLVQTHVIPKKKLKLEHGIQPSVSMTENITKRLQSFSYSTHSLYGDMPGSAHLQASSAFSIASKLGLPVPNLAPNVEEGELVTVPKNIPTPSVVFTVEDSAKEPVKKKYAKEAWPGKKPTHSFLV